MINLDYGITYISGIEGASYLEGEHARVYVIVAYNPEKHDFQTFLAIAADAIYARKGITDQFDLMDQGYKVVTVSSLYSMLKKLEKALK